MKCAMEALANLNEAIETREREQNNTLRLFQMQAQAEQEQALAIALERFDVRLEQQIKNCTLDEVYIDVLRGYYYRGTQFCSLAESAPSGRRMNGVETRWRKNHTTFILSDLVAMLESFCYKVSLSSTEIPLCGGWDAPAIRITIQPDPACIK